MTKQFEFRQKQFNTFRLKKEEDYRNAVSIEDIDHYSSWWYRILNFLFSDYLKDDKPHWEPEPEDPEEIDEEDITLE